MFLFLASGFYSGYLPKAPGTWGTLISIPLILISYSFGVDLIFLSGLLFILGWFLCEKLTDDLEVDPDPSFIVIDEIAGMFLTVALCLYFRFIDDLGISQIVGLFFLFRLFDIWKPWPIGFIDKFFARYRLSRGFGIMIDDTLAAIWAVLAIFFFMKIVLYFT